MTTTTTAPRMMTSADGLIGFLHSSKVILQTEQHEYDPSAHPAFFNVQEGEVCIQVRGAKNDATFWMPTEEARLLAQAILDATA